MRLVGSPGSRSRYLQLAALFEKAELRGEVGLRAFKIVLAEAENPGGFNWNMFMAKACRALGETDEYNAHVDAMRPQANPPESPAAAEPASDAAAEPDKEESS